MSQHGRKNNSTCSVWKMRVASPWEGRSAGLIRVSCEGFSLTRNCSRCLSDSGVNSADMGMTSPARIMIALRKQGRQNRNAYFSPVTDHSSSPSSTSSVWRLTCCPPRLPHRASRASRWPPGQCSLLRCCRLPFPFLFAYPAQTETTFFFKIPYDPAAWHLQKTPTRLITCHKNCQ